MNRLRDANREKVIAVLSKTDAMSASALGEAAGMHSATARRVVAELVSEGIVREHMTSTHTVWSLTAKGSGMRGDEATGAMIARAVVEAVPRQASSEDRVSAAKRLFEIETEIERLKVERAEILSALAAE